MHKRAFQFKCLFLIMISMMLYLLSPSRFGYGYEQEQQQSDSSSSNAERMRPDDPMELGVYLDEFINQKMEEHHIPGLVFVLVKDGEIFFSKGYGYADVEKKTPVEPAETVFRVGSVSKLLTATAAMQLSSSLKVSASGPSWSEGSKLRATIQLGGVAPLNRIWWQVCSMRRIQG